MISVTHFLQKKKIEDNTQVKALEPLVPSAIQLNILEHDH